MKAIFFFVFIPIQAFWEPAFIFITTYQNYIFLWLLIFNSLETDYININLKKFKEI